ncbi:MAG: ectoine/hydroxyectoine ABC transporter permease subunit EhuD [Candidatus Promineifilaceae bacterium]|nr:ectoine/hydroxyectoine ABC transporter permease subunit EhuD [Candidatus Promineifilaceae bacterium]
MRGPVWDWEFVIEILPRMLEGLQTTIVATVIAFGVAAVVGLLMALGRRSENRWISLPTTLVVEFIRMTPLLVQLFFFFFVLPRYGLRLPALLVGVIALGLHYGTYNSEVYRAGIDAITKGQWEAATALNFSSFNTWRRIILPQAIPPMYPALGNYLVAMFKESAQLYAISVVELTTTALTIGTETFRYLEPITMAGALYLLVSYPSSLLVQRLEARYARRG